VPVAVVPPVRQIDTLSDTLTGGRKRKRADEPAARPVLLRGENIAWIAVDGCKSFS